MVYGVSMVIYGVWVAFWFEYSDMMQVIALWLVSMPPVMTT